MDGDSAYEGMDDNTFIASSQICFLLSTVPNSRSLDTTRQALPVGPPFIAASL